MWWYWVNEFLGWKGINDDDDENYYFFFFVMKFCKCFDFFVFVIFGNVIFFGGRKFFENDLVRVDVVLSNVEGVYVDGINGYY